MTFLSRYSRAIEQSCENQSWSSVRTSSSPSDASLLRKTCAGTGSHALSVWPLAHSRGDTPEPHRTEPRVANRETRLSCSNAEDDEKLCPTTSHGFFRTFRTAKNATCNEVQRTVAAPEPGTEDQLLLIEPRSFGEVRFRVIIEMNINFTVGHAARLALMAKSVL